MTWQNICDNFDPGAWSNYGGQQSAATYPRNPHTIVPVIHTAAGKQAILIKLEHYSSSATALF